ncbi:MAG TPA: helix-turn-helix domain-containing protein [Actinopolymorphaceae bacterium]
MAALRGRVRREDVAGRRHRAEGILAAAGELIERWGYAKTTIDDIARAAGVAKGTIYLHWKTRDALFHALLRSERVAMLTQIRAELAAYVESGADADPTDFLRRLVAIVLGRPLLLALFLRDRDVLGRLVNRRAASAPAADRSEYVQLLERFRSWGVIRTDRPTREQITMINAAYAGVLAVNPLVPEHLRLSLEEQADVIADMIARALAPSAPVPPEVTAKAAAAGLDYLDQALELARRKLDDALGLTGPRGEDDL